MPKFIKSSLPVMVAFGLAINPLLVMAAAPNVNTTLRDQLGNDADSDGNVDRGDTVIYEAEVDNTAGSDQAQSVIYDATLDVNTTLVPGSIKVTPVAVGDAYNGVSGLTLSMDVANGLLSNDFDPKDANVPTNIGMTVVPEVVATAQGGTATLFADGSFEYTAPGGFTGIDSFSYTARDTDSMTDTGIVSMNITGRIWFVDSAAAAGGDGSQALPFNDLSSLNGAGGAGDLDQAGDMIYFYAGSYSDSLDLENNQTVIGSGSNLVIAGKTYLNAGTAPSFTGQFQLADNNMLEGMNLIPTSGYAVSANGALNGVLNNVGVTLSGSTGALNLVNHTGNFAVAGSITGASTVSAVAIDGGNAAYTLNTDIILSGGRLVDVQNTSGGSLGVAGVLVSDAGSAININNNSGNSAYNFNSVTVTNGNGTAVNLTNNGAATFSFNSDFNVVTSNGSGLVANSGLLSLADAASVNNVLNTSGGSALELNGVTLSTLSFDAISSNNSTSDGINLTDVTGTINPGVIVVTNPADNGIEITGGTLAFNNVATSIEITNPVNEGIKVTGNSLGNLVFADITMLQGGAQPGVSISDTTNPVTLGTYTLEQGERGLLLSNTSGGVTFDSVSLGQTAALTTNGVLLSGNNSGVINLGNGVIDAASPFTVDGGTADVTFGGNVNQTNSGATLLIANHSAGTVTLDGATIQADSGTGIQFSSASGTYNISAVATLAGGDAALDVVSSSGTISFSDLSITNPSGIGILVNTGTPNLTISAGTVTTNNTSNGVKIGDLTGGSINIGATMNLITGTANAIDLTNNGAGSITLSGLLDLDTTSGHGINASGGTLVVSGSTVAINTQTGSVVRLNAVTVGAGGVDISSAAASGLVPTDVVNITGVSGNTITIDSLSSAGTSAGGDLIEVNTSSAVTNFGVVTANNINGDGLNLVGANGVHRVDSLTLDAVVGRGIYVSGNTNTVLVSAGNIGSTTPVTGNSIDIEGGSGAVAINTNITNTGNRILDITGRTGGSVLIGGQLNETGTGVNISNNTGGTLQITGTSKVLNTAANTALNMSNNTSFTTQISNGGLDIDVTTAAGLLASNAGSLEVTGANNTINSTSGTSASISNTTIGAGNVSFTSITQSGGSNAINLNSTGTTGSFRINGTATTVGSGGTISGISQEAILLTNTTNPYFNGLSMSNITREAIKGVAVNGLSVTNGSFSNVGSTDVAADDDVFGFVRDTLGDNGLTGTALFQNLTITGAHERAIDVVNEGSGTLDLDIINVSVDDNDDIQGEDAIRVQSEGSINTDLLVSGGTFNNIELDAVAYFAQGTGTNNVTVTGITSTNGGGPDNAPNGGGIAIIGSGPSTTTFNINNNNLTGVQGEGVQIVGLGGPNQILTMRGSITGNTIESRNADGIDLDFDGDIAGTSTINLTIDVNNNTMSFDDDGLGIDYRDAAGTGNFTVRNNQLSVIAGDDGITTDSDDGIFIFTDSDIASGNSHINVAIQNNTFSGIDAIDKNIVVEDVQDAGTSACFNITGNSAGAIELDFEATSNGGEVTQASTAAIAADNNGSTVTVITEAPIFNSTKCSSVPLP